MHAFAKKIKKTLNESVLPESFEHRMLAPTTFEWMESQEEVEKSEKSEKFVQKQIMSKIGVLIFIYLTESKQSKL